MTHPRRRRRDLIVRESGGETLVLDERTGSVHCLPPELAHVWRSLGTPSPLYDAAALAELDALGLLEPGFDRRRFLARAGLVGAGTLGAATMMSPAALAAGSTAASGPLVYNLITLYGGPNVGPTFGKWQLASGESANALSTPLNPATVSPPSKVSTSANDLSTRVSLATDGRSGLQFQSDPTSATDSAVGAIFTLPNPGNVASLILAFSGPLNGATVSFGDPNGTLTQVVTNGTNGMTQSYTPSYTSSTTTSLVVAVSAITTPGPITVTFTTLVAEN